ncbi:Hypothetical predicted protein [Lecanosticta acicola]|uniref:SGNH hydrolase-type esterase domain-containing protein n=1 Tax=Lecanosticta acicola TaxID=111012 RepID=A0AAI8YT83_9PEZI|nr:Hypothetical predicted protein [Lecanosticta acicola]
MAPSNGIPRPDNSTLRILAFGDSLTEGYTDFGMTFHPYGDALRDTLQESFPNLEITVKVEGMSGDCVLPSLGGFNERLRGATKSREPPEFDLIILLGGTNDLAYKMGAGAEGSREIFEEGLEPLYEYVLETRSNLMVVTVPERAVDSRGSELGRRAKGYREELNRMITEWAKAHEQSTPKVFLFDLAPKVPYSGDDGKEPGERVWSPDGLHMSANGYDLVGRELAKLVGEIL